MALVTVSKFRGADEADFARRALEVEGIAAVVAGADLQVDEHDVDDADVVLNRLTGMAGAEHVAPSDAGPWQPPQACPSCGASEVARRQKWIAFGVFAIFAFAIAYTQDATLVGFYVVAAAAVFALVAANWRCRNCGHTW
jgi:hypothetical protein